MTYWHFLQWWNIENTSESEQFWCQMKQKLSKQLLPGYQHPSGFHKMHQISFRPGLCPGPSWGSSRCSLDHLVNWGRGHSPSPQCLWTVCQFSNFHRLPWRRRLNCSIPPLHDFSQLKYWVLCGWLIRNIWGDHLFEIEFNSCHDTVRANCLLLASVLWRCWLGVRKGIQPVKKTEWWDVGVVVCMGCRLAYSPAYATATHYLLLQ